MRNSLLYKIRIMTALLVASVLIVFSNTAADAAYCTPTNNYAPNSYNMRINLVEFDKVTIMKWDGQRDSKGNLILPCSTNPANKSGSTPCWRDVEAGNTVIKADKDKEYDMRCYGGASTLYAGSMQPENVSPSGSYPQDFVVYVDCDQNGKFEESEKVGSYISTAGVFDRTFKVKIPKTAKSGNTTLRIVCDYYGNSGNYITACTTYYGETRDFAMTISGGVDIGISQISSPVAPLTEGIHTVKAILKNFSSTVVTKCTIKWSVDGVDQTPVDWTGTLGALSQQEVTLGDFNFASKGIRTTYTILASTLKPNGEDDETPLNDACPAYSLSLPISSGIYYIGGTDYDFLTLKELTDLMNTTGIKNDGDFIVRMRPGTYYGPFTLNNFTHGKNKFIFEPDPAFVGNVTLAATTTVSAPYVFSINNLSDVTFRNLTFTVNDPNKVGGKILMLRGNVNNYAIENNVFNGTKEFSQTAYQYSLIDCQSAQMNNHIYSKNVFNDGNMSLVLLNTSRTSKGLLIDKNKFNSFTNRAIQVEGIADGVISNNTIKASSNQSFAGIVVYDGTDITNNSISGIIGSSTSGGGIIVNHSAITAPAVISGNSISNCSGINGLSVTGIDGGTINKNSINLGNTNYGTATAGIALNNATLKTTKVTLMENAVTIENGFGLNITNYPVDILKNKVQSIKTGSTLNLRGVSCTNTNGYILANEIISGGEVLEVDKSNLVVAYNSGLALGSSAALSMESGNNKLFRNQLVNKGTGPAITMTAANNALLDGNNYMSTSGTLAVIGGTNYSNATQLLPLDKNARSKDPQYLDNTSLKIVELSEDLLFTTPIANLNWPAGYQSAYEEITLDGKYRDGTYYIGAYTIVPVVDIIKYTKELIDCAGAKDMAIICSGKANLGSQPKYQWYKDGVLLPGETSHKLSFPNFNYPTSGIYKCKVYAPGVAKPLWSGDIPVYALTTPEITDQPKEVINAQLGGTYNFEVKAHYRGLVPPYYEHFYQWYKYTAATDQLVPLANNERFEGTTASKFVITGLTDTDICEKGDYYFVEITSQCGIIRSNPFIISQKPEVVFRDNPKDINVCPKSDVVFQAFAVAPDGYKIDYSWKKDGVDLTDNDIYNGARTAKLQIFGATANEAGAYTCIATIASEGISVNSANGILTFKEEPNGIPVGGTDFSIKRGSDVTFKVNKTAGVEPLTIKWTFKGEVIKEGLWNIYTGSEMLTLVLEAINENQAGEYICTIENECAVKEIKFNLTVKKWDEANSVEVVTENGYSLYTAVPNPASDKSTINYIMAKSGNVRFTLSDLSGKVLRNLYNGYAVEGMNTLEINVKDLNLPAGVYFYTMTSDNFSGVRSFVIVE